MPPPTPTDPVVHWTAPLYPEPAVLAPAAIPVETPADPSDPLRDGVALVLVQLPPVDDLMQIAFDMPAASVASLATTVPSSELAYTADLEGGDDREARAFAREVPSAPSLSGPPRIGTSRQTSSRTLTSACSVLGPQLDGDTRSEVDSTDIAMTAQACQQAFAGSGLQPDRLATGTPF